MTNTTTTGERNLARLAEDAYERFGDRESTYYEGRWYRSGELFDRVARVAGGLREVGVEPGDRVAVNMANSPDVAVLYNAIWRAGCVATPAIFLLPPDELRHVLADSGATAVVTSPEFVANVRAAADGVASVRAIVCGDTDGAAPEGMVALGDLAGADAAGIEPRADGDLAALLYTGGTTGRAKGVPLSHGNLWFCAKATHDAGYVEGVTRTIVPLPLAHAYGLVITVAGGHVREPGRSVLMRWFDPEGFLKLVAEHGVQRATLVPSMIQMLLEQPLEDHDTTTLAYVNCGASPLAVEVAQEFERRVPSATVLEGYGCTESGGIAATNPPHARRLGTVGRALPGYEIRVVDEDDAALGPDEVGEVTIRSPGVASRYWNAPDATEHAFRDGWLFTGDLGSLDDDGYLTIVDRKKDVIIRGGFNVYPRDVEDALLEHPAIAMAGVVGRPHDRYGEEVVAFVQLAPAAEATPEELVAFTRERLGGYRYPREIHVVEQVPLTPVLKVDRKALRDLL